jgi:catechol 2,3-dioxygenase-like lactoylglutathione lyase family enzyme
VNIFSTDVPDAIAFYQKVLFNPQKDCDWCEHIPSGTLLINRRQTIRLVPAPKPVPSNLISEIVFATDDVHGLRNYLEEQKIQIRETPENKKTDSFLSVVDPEGHRISFMQVADAPAPYNGKTPDAAPSTSLRLIHAGFIVHDRNATEHFYKDVLGFRPYWHGGMKNDQTDWVSMQVPDGTDWIEFMVNVPKDADQRLRGIMDHIAIGVADIHAAEQHVRATGAPVTEEPKIGRDGKWQLNLYDPDKTRVEFMEFKPKQEPCCSPYTGTHPGPNQ